jgi:hypothetical protein
MVFNKGIPFLQVLLVTIAWFRAESWQPNPNPNPNPNCNPNCNCNSQPVLVSSPTSISSTPQQHLDWELIRIRITLGKSDDDSISNVDDSESSLVVKPFQEGDSIILLHSIVTKEECRDLVHAARQAAEKHCRQRAFQNLPDQGLARLRLRIPTQEAAERAATTNTPCAEALDRETSAVCEKILSRILQTLDEKLPSLAAHIFGNHDNNLSAESHLRENKVVFASREPAINVYYSGGQFLAHEDGQALTVLIPLTESPQDYTGGGTAFWSSDSRGHRVEPPSLVLKPGAGTAMLFGGHVTHAGVPVQEGERVVLVASLSPKQL